MTRRKTLNEAEAIATGLRDMLPAERRARIAGAIRERRTVRVPELSRHFGVSEITIRRDLLLLEREGLLNRTYGGAILNAPPMTGRGAREPIVAAASPNDAVAAAAATMIEPRDTVFVGSGRVGASILRHMDPAHEVRIVTHNLAVVDVARDLSLEVLFLGGLYRPQSDAVEGAWPLSMIDKVYADKTFLGADYLDIRAGLTTSSMAMAEVDLAMIRRTLCEVVVLVDSSRIGRVAPLAICPLEQIDVVFVDDGIDPALAQQIQCEGPQCEVIPAVELGRRVGEARRSHHRAAGAGGHTNGDVARGAFRRSRQDRLSRPRRQLHGP